LLQVMERMVVEADAIRESIGRTVVSNLKAMARMGAFLECELRRVYPEFPLRKGVLSWEDNLPPLHQNLKQLVEEYDATAVAAGAGR